MLAICKHFGVALDKLPLRIWCRPGESSFIATISDEGREHPGDFYQALVAQLAEFGPCLLVTDTVTDVAELNENKRPPVNTLCKRVLGRLCQHYGVTLLVTAHPSKAAMNDGSNYSGSTAWNNAVRIVSRSFLKKGNISWQSQNRITA